MTRLTTTSFALAAALGVAAVSACAGSAPTSVPTAYLEGTALDRNAIRVAKRTEFLEIGIDPAASELSVREKAQIRTFVSSYREVGHGPLILSLPVSSANPQLAISAVAEARAIAWENGVSYEEIEGTHHGADSLVAEPLILAYQRYDAIAPECHSLATIDVSDVSSNNEMPTLGCAVRTNLAAMIADPADLLGQRPLDEADPLRRSVILEKFRAGEVTGAERSDDESGNVSSAVAN